MSACWACSQGGGVRMSDFTRAIGCLARELVTTGTGVRVSLPPLFVSGPRTTVGPTAALTLHVNHPPAAQRWFGGRVRVSNYYQSAEPSVSRVRSITIACLGACNCALPGVRSQGRDRGARPAHRI